MKLPFGGAGKGSVGNIVTQGGRFGDVQRQRVIPVNPQTARQMTQRSILAAVASEWRGLTQTVRNGWTSLANSVGGSLTGFNMYVKLNATRITCGQAVLAAAPANPAFGILTLGALTADVSAQTNIIAACQTTVAADKYMVYATDPVPPGIESFGTRFRLIGIKDTADVPVETLSVA
jgi:hypothetical protein